MKHMMVDAETLAVGTFPALLQIGAVVFDDETQTVGEGVCLRIGVLSAIVRGASVDASTVAFWAGQDPAAADSVSKGEHWALPDALKQLASFYASTSCERVWSHGLASDLLWLANAYAACGMPLPWTHRAPRDTRTLFEVAEGRGWAMPEFDGAGLPAHDAQADAHSQAKQVLSAIAFLRGNA